MTEVTVVPSFSPGLRSKKCQRLAKIRD